ncbi:pyrimidine-nucleoside phosphorylase [Tissierella creatinophila]|uniref:Pyrimidine-nucleoside phosphorylase n=1 Tax=Tissierella creatinophila DSM 6911 TaxID=1123403 RepID=A0A1U7M9K1_TISCR|nr:pyrimidine-nucleoside phosphorylase [Tissierella creatinophila]OLS03951.1 pyrimidine-nucleoside phosphorylase [Tissierella creatinophila DSM 6911]
MRIYDIIKRKRDGLNLSPDEIDYFVKEYTHGSIPDYQISSLLMAIFLKEMNDEETLFLTKAMVESGETVDLSSIKGLKVDKHSTGGVGDSVTLILGPMIAACGVPFVKMSGRGLGHTGGTLDKLESIEGFQTDISKEEFINNANEIGISICSQTANITPADKKLYALRDVTATVENISLIASSIMSKKLAINSDGIILDVKVGNGAFMKNLDEAKHLAKTMVNIGNNYGRNTMAIVTNMDQPLGNAIGNNLEVKEAINTLKGNGPDDLFELCIILGSKLLVLAKKVKTEKEGRDLLKEVINSGKAYNKFLELVKYQHGDIREIENPNLFPKAKYIIAVKSNKKGFIKEINAEKIGKCALSLGAGRETLESKLDLSVGIMLNKKIDDEVELGEDLAYIHTNDKQKGELVKNKILEIYKIGEKNKQKQTLVFYEIH